MPELIVVDTSCLIALSRINHIRLLNQVYDRLIVTPEIKQEFKFELPDWVEVRSTNSNRDLAVITSLVDLGEASAIEFCLKHTNSLLIIDDSKGRKLAKKLGVKVTGTHGVLVKAKKIGKIELVKPYLDALEKVDFRFDAKLKKMILQSVGE